VRSTLQAVPATVPDPFLNHTKKLILFGVLWFGIALGPAAHVIPSHILRADRYLYLPLAGLAVAVAMSLVSIGNVCEERTSVVRRMAMATVGLAVIAALALGSAEQIQIWRSSLSAWEHCLRLHPNSAKAHDAFADNLVADGQIQRAVDHYQESLRLNPKNTDAAVNLILKLSADKPEMRDYETAISMVEKYCEMTHRRNPEILHTAAVAYTNFGRDLESAGYFDHALECYEKALSANPDYEICLFNLALLLATCPDEKLRRPDEAVRLAEKACLAVDDPRHNDLMILAAAYAEADRIDDAISSTEKAIRLAEASGDVELIGQLRGSLTQYQDRARAESQR